MKTFDRLSLLTYLIRHAPNEWVGRTALVKFCYLLQTVYKVPLGYRFTLYSYGPFDSQVLADIGEAESLGFVRSTLEMYSSGYGYRIECVLDEDEFDEVAAAPASSYQEELRTLLKLFGGRSAGQLELDTTIVFVYRQLGSLPSLDAVAQKVHEVKPHFDQSDISKRIIELIELEVL